MNDILKIAQALGDSDILLKGVPKTIENEIKIQKGGFWGMLLGTPGASLLRNLLTRTGIVKVGSRNWKRKGTVRAGSGSKKGKRFLRDGYRKQYDF